MKQRIIVAVIGIPLLLAILCVAPDWATAALLAALSVVGTHELLAAVCGPEKTRRWTALPAVMGILVVLHFYGAGHGWQLPLGIVDGLLLVGVIALPAVGVLYGYGSRGELEPFAPLYLAPSAGALRAWLLQRKDQGEAALPEKE